MSFDLTLEDSGVVCLPGVLSAAEVAETRAALVRAAAEYQRLGGQLHMPVLDPNERNVRVFDLLALDGLFRDLILHPRAVERVAAVLGDSFLISNFTANIALPGSGSMAIHSDQGLVAPQPWLAPWSVNVIWCLDDVSAANGGTRYLPGSHRYQTLADVPPDAGERMLSIEASAGSIVLMDGRVWHTSGANSTADQERALLFAYYCVDFLRPQVNWNVVLQGLPEGSLSRELSERLGLGRTANFRHGAALLKRST